MVAKFVILVIFCTKLHGSLSWRSVSVNEVLDVHFDSGNTLHVVNQFSPSVAVGMGLFVYNRIKDLGNPKLITLVKALGPSYLRMGGIKSDRSYFVVDSGAEKSCTGNNRNQEGRLSNRQHIAQAGMQPIRHTRFKNIFYSASEFDRFMNFVSSTDMKLIFGLNLRHRNGSKWNPTSALKLLDHAKLKGYRIDWQLGNEPNSYRYTTGNTISARQVAKDFLAFNDILKSDNWWRESMLSGPDTNRMYGCEGRTFLRTFLRHAGNATNSVTFHQPIQSSTDSFTPNSTSLVVSNDLIENGLVLYPKYYINSVNATVNNFTDYKILNKFHRLIANVVKAVRKENRDIPIWIGETSSSYGGGADGLSNTYVAGFMWLDKLGISAANGIDNVFRQTLIQGNYALLSRNFDPNPDYWLTLLYKILVGREVLNASVSAGRNSTEFQTNGKFRVYAHCTNVDRTSYAKGAVTLAYSNLLSMKQVIRLNATSVHLKPRVAMTYILTSPNGNLTSRDVYLNGERLQMIDAHTMPKLNPVEIDLAREKVILPETSFGFIVLPDVRAPACIAP